MLNIYIDVLLKILMFFCKYVENYIYSYREILLSFVNKSFSNRFFFFFDGVVIVRD